MKVFRCSHSGLLLPPDYAKEWGRKYGVGLGPNVVSECVDTHYWRDPPHWSQRGIRSVEQIMHPVCPTYAQVDLIDHPAEKWEDIPADQKMILRSEPDSARRRAAVLLQKQLQNSQQLRMMHAAAREKGLY